MAKKRKKAKPSEDCEIKSISSGESSDTDFAECEENITDKYTPYRVNDYSRRYPEDSAAGSEFIVFVESMNQDQPIGTRDMMFLNGCFSRFVKGIKYMKKINKFKIGVIFERPSLANAFMDNTTFLKEQCLKAQIPAQSTELTGVISSVPTDMSNKKIFKVLASSKKIICVRRIMKKVEGSLQPTQTVTITFASSTTLPDYVYLKMWRIPVLPYIPPVKQCFKCLRYGHLAKFCKNAQRCSICTEGHSFKECQVSVDKAICVHCKGNHISISGQCPIKKQKIIENKNKVSPNPYTTILKSKNFPSLDNEENSKDLLTSLLNDRNALTMLMESLIKVLTENKTQNTSINTQVITQCIKETMQRNNKNATLETS